MEYNLADLFENAVDHFPDRECLVAEGKHRTFKELDERANRLAHHLADSGIGAGDHVGIYAYNCVEWVETLWAVFKLRAVWVNINYRYVEDELAYIFDNADLKALVYAREFGPRAAAVRDKLPLLKHTICIEDGSGADCSQLESTEFEQAVASGSPERDFGPRSADDRYILYTGGTTGMPKGVVWRHEDVFMVLGGGIDPTTNTKCSSPEEIAEREKDGQTCMMALAPLMHGATQWCVMAGSFTGRKTVLVSKFDPIDTWRLVEEEKINGIMITGDAMGRPLVEALATEKDKRDLSSFFLLVSSAAVFSPTVKDDFFEHFPNLMMIDSVGASEVGNNGAVMIGKGNTTMGAGGPTISPLGGTVVLDENLMPLEAGSDVIGKIARHGHIPLEYYKDPVKSAEVYVTGPDGTRYSMPGDFARVEPDGQITLLGRGSVCINSGGEKIYPEEVEAAVKSHPDVYDAVVVGVPDERWGSRVTAVVQGREGITPQLDSIQTHCRTKIAGYKIPRELHLVSQMVRSPSGKADYPWAKRIALGEETA
jgi:acyl-CoA synthetase (AMP-forming)/AMP-acid ligase II